MDDSIKVKPIPTVTEIENNPKLIAQMIDHTLLKPEATPEQVIRLCEEARQYEFASVCINPAYVKLAVKELDGTGIPVCTVAGFPLGATTTQMKALETDIAVSEGALEVDMVINVGQLKVGNFEFVLDDIKGVVLGARKKALVKVILETCLLTNDEIVKACQLVEQAGADFVKTSTGFNKAGATMEHVQLMRQSVKPETGVKAAGGIRDFATAFQMVQAGATRIGASASVAIVNE